MKHYLVDFDSDGDARDRARLRRLEEDIDTVIERFEGVVVPKGVRHRPKAPGGATVLMVEQNTIVPTGS